MDGMLPFRPVFRTNNIEIVSCTARQLTIFEMFGLDPRNLVVSVVREDDEADPSGSMG